MNKVNVSKQCNSIFLTKSNYPDAISRLADLSVTSDDLSDEE